MNHTITEIARCAGCLCTSSGLFKYIEPHRTYMNHTSTEIARCEGCLCTSSGEQFKRIKPPRTYTNHDITGVLGAYLLVQGGSSTLNLTDVSFVLVLPSNKKTKPSVSSSCKPSACATVRLPLLVLLRLVTAVSVRVLTAE